MNEFTIHDAAEDCRIGLDKVRQFIEAGVPVDSLNEQGQTPLHRAAYSGQYEVAALLINSKCDLEIKDHYQCQTPIMLAASCGRKDIVDLLLHHGAQVNCVDGSGKTLLHRVIFYTGWTDTVRLILDNGEADLNAVDKYGDTPLMCAARIGNEEVAALLIRAGAAVNGVDGSGLTLLHTVSWTNTVQLILDNGGADLNAVDQYGNTPLMIAVRKGNDEVAALLVRAGAALNRSDVRKRTALHLAVEWGYIWIHRSRMTQILLEKEGLDLNPQDDNGNTPLHVACVELGRGYRKGFIKQLLDAGANINVKNNEGEFALSVGIRRNALTIEEIRLFVEKGAFFENCDYACISRDPFLKENVLKDVELCTQSVVNKFNRQSLPALNSIAYFARRLPNVDNFKLGDQHIAEVENLVKSDIERNTFCNVVKVRPIALSALCVLSLLSLITCQSGKKRAASTGFGHSPFKKNHN